jgi:2-C-methyl-D-erythritol 4-phosphate cytidylyltransferase
VRLLLLVPAAGAGERLGRDGPKALVPVGNRPMLARALEVFEAFRFERGIVLSPPGKEAEFERAIGGRWPVAPGGATRSDSVAIGFARLAPAPDDFVVIHDAARPFIRAEDVGAVIEAARREGAAIGVTAVPDTLKRISAGRVERTIDREQVAAAATPQVFRADLLRRALAETGRATDEAARLEALNMPIAAVQISRRAFKITYPEDLELAEAMARSTG